MKKPRKRAPRCIIIAGPNGAGKTTFAQEFLPKYVNVVHFVNADLIASGLSPLSPGNAAIAAGRLFLKELAENRRCSPISEELGEFQKDLPTDCERVDHLR